MTSQDPLGAADDVGTPEPTLDEQWDLLYSNQLSVEDRDALYRVALAQFDEVFHANRDVRADVLAILSRWLGRDAGIESRTYSEVVDALTAYGFGTHAIKLLTWLLWPDQPTVLSDVRVLASDPVSDLLGAVLGIYGADLENALLLAGEDADDWRRVTHDVYLDQLTGTYVLRVKIFKYDGSNFLISGSPDSILNLCHQMVRNLGLVGREGFRPDLVAEFAETVSTVLGRFQPEPVGPEPVPASVTPD